VKKYALCVVLLITLPASAGISWVQTQKAWNCTLMGSGATITCQVITGTHTTTNNLLAVWDILAIVIYLHGFSQRPV